MLKKLYVFIFSLLLIATTSNTFACDKTAKSSKCSDNKTYSAKRYSASRDLIRYSLKLQALKLTGCRKKVNILDHVASDLTTIRKQLSKKGKFRLSKDLPMLKKYSLRDIRHKINKSKRITGNIDKICRSLESEYKGRYKKAKRNFFKPMGIKTKH